MCRLYFDCTLQIKQSSHSPPQPCWPYSVDEERAMAEQVALSLTLLLEDVKTDDGCQQEDWILLSFVAAGAHKILVFETLCSLQIALKGKSLHVDRLETGYVPIIQHGALLTFVHSLKCTNNTAWWILNSLKVCCGLENTLFRFVH